MSETSDQINAAAKASITGKASMLHAFDITLTTAELKLIMFACAGELNPDTTPLFRVSLSRVDEEVILGFENTSNGNRVTITYPNNANFTFWDELPDWLGDGDFHIVTNDSISSIDLNYIPNLAYQESNNDLHKVVIVSLEGMWIGMNQNWGFRQHHLTGESAENDFRMVLQPFPIQQFSTIGGSAMVNASGRISCEAKAKVSFKSASMAKSVLGKAGRSKPQGDLIVYFSKDSCAAEGCNSAGVTTLELQSIGGKRQIESYQSSIEEDTIMGVKFPYPFYFRALFSTKDGVISAEDAKSATIDYGVTEHEKPYLAVNLASGKCIEIVLQSEQDVFKEEGLTLPEFALTPKTSVAKSRAKPVITSVKRARWENVKGVPEGYEEDVERWFNAYFETKSDLVTEDIELNVSAWFSAYLVKQAREGNTISIRDRDAYREVTNLLK
tara:strand:+ start:6899 stop:8224 length:1326 start_codon:yes stop_codon:yes gene_type:complete